jgi:ribonucleotide reductase beta subunit family protein with ferritin-like domain
MTTGNGTAFLDLEAPTSSTRSHASEKRLINCHAVDVNQLMPLKYAWAWEHYLNGCANHWMPTEVAMGADIALWKSCKGKLSADERLVIMRNLGFFATAESLVANNITLALFRHVTNAECRQYLLRQAFGRRSTPTPSTTSWRAWGSMSAKSSACTTRFQPSPRKTSWR